MTFRAFFRSRKELQRMNFSAKFVSKYFHQDITEDDLLRATKKLRVLGTGFTVIPLDSGRYLVQVIFDTTSLPEVSHNVALH